jgi:glycosyltransferase 2 family protein
MKAQRLAGLGGAGVRRRLSAWGRVVAPALVLAILIWRLGTNPFLHGLRTVNGGALAAAAGLVVLTTLCSAWRWKVVAGALGVEVSLPAAVSAYYRSMFLNVTLPGGVVGDIHRAISHGRDVGEVGRALRSVAWERFAGQVVQVVITVAVLLALPSPVHAYMPLVVVAVLAAVCGLLLLARARPDGARSGFARIRSAAADDIRHGLLARRAWPVITLASALVVVGHVATFLLAARTAGVSAPLSRMLPIALLVIAAMVLPSFGGWGPREAVTAWAFSAVGLGAQAGIATAVVYGVMVFAASLPGAAVLVVAWFRRNRPPKRTRPSLRERPAHA